MARSPHTVEQSTNRKAGGDAKSTEDFNPLWIREFKKTNSYEVWDRTTDPVLFDIVEPRSISFPHSEKMHF